MRIKLLRIIAKATWYHIEKQSRPDGVHVRLLLDPKGDLCIEADVHIRGKRYAVSRNFPDDYQDLPVRGAYKWIEDTVRHLRKICINTKLEHKKK